MEIRDPIHGPIEVSPPEKAVIDHPLVQRLRRIRQLGFAEDTFPGATHTRFLHSVGTMHLAGLAFDAVARDLAFVPPSDLARARATVRLAALLHDLGHPPMSHGGERLLPSVRAIGEGTDDRTATHEEMTRALVLRSDLADTISREMAGSGVRPGHVAAVLAGRPLGDDPFTFGSATILPLLGQLIAGELDVDRMDYLLRDSYFTGVAYGRFEKDWLLSRMGAHRAGPAACQAIDSTAVHAFEDFLLSRYHMFLMVYSHPKTAIYHRMLVRFIEGPDGAGLRCPVDEAAFARCDDEWLLAALRASPDPSARRITTRDPLRLVAEAWDDDARALDRLRPALDRALPHDREWLDAAVEFSKLYPEGVAARPGFPALVVRVRHPGPRRAVLPVHEYSDLFTRQTRWKRVLRLYCDEGEAQAAGAVLAAVAAGGPEAL
ncbi:MAG: HD domain-containing protein [Deltaproteobacteria bacterium]|nr:HD domain-containing protein [Deltaproteobacteria bacterium]